MFPCVWSWKFVLRLLVHLVWTPRVSDCFLLSWERAGLSCWVDCSCHSHAAPKDQIPAVFAVRASAAAGGGSQTHLMSLLLCPAGSCCWHTGRHLCLARGAVSRHSWLRRPRSRSQFSPRTPLLSLPAAVMAISDAVCSGRLRASCCVLTWSLLSSGGP